MSKLMSLFIVAMLAVILVPNRRPVPQALPANERTPKAKNNA